MLKGLKFIMPTFKLVLEIFFCISYLVLLSW